MSPQLKLQVMICTYGAQGLRRLSEMQLPQIEGVGYLISCQQPNVGGKPTDHSRHMAGNSSHNTAATQAGRLDVETDLTTGGSIEEIQLRPDITVVYSDTKGLSINRNHALSHVTAPYALIADDDIDYYAEGLLAIIDAFERHPGLDIATFMLKYPRKVVYPPYELDLNQKFKNYNISSCEIALRMSSIKKSGLKFSPDMGIGAPYLKAGEENMFLLACFKHGMKGRFFPTTIGSHDHDTTTTHQQLDPGVIRSTGAYVALAQPFTAALRIPLIAKRLNGSTLQNAKYLLQGALYALKHRKSLLRP